MMSHDSIIYYRVFFEENHNIIHKNNVSLSATVVT